MNKIISNKFSLICLLVLIGSMFLTTGCKKEDKVTLNGTVWKGTYTDNGSYGYTDNVVLSFQENTFIMLEHIYYNDGSTDSYTTTGSYTYNPPNVILLSSDFENGKANGTVTGNTLMLTNDNGVVGVLTKQ